MNSPTFSRGRQCVLVCAMLGLLALPAAASAEVYCVDTSHASCTQTGLNGVTGFQSALNAATASPGADTVRLGGQTYAAPTDTGFNYFDDDPIEVIGTGLGGTSIDVFDPLAPPGGYTTYTGLALNGTDRASVSNLTVNMPEPPDTANLNQLYRGIHIGGKGELFNVQVDTPDSEPPINGVGVAITAGTVTGAILSLPRNQAGPGSIGIVNPNYASDNLTVQDSVITARDPISYANDQGGTALVRRSYLRVGPSGVGVNANAGPVEVRATMISLGASDSATGIAAGYANTGNETPSTAVVDGVTIHGSGSGTRGLRAFATDANTPALDPDIATIEASNVILDQGLTTSIDRRDDEDGDATVEIDHSNFDPADFYEESNTNGVPPTGVGDIVTGAGNLNVVSGFENAAGGDFSLLPSSPLLEMGTPGAATPGETDFEGEDRVMDGPDADCVAARDIGADELAADPPSDCTPPDTAIISGPAGATSDSTPTFGFTSEAGATFECRVDAAAFAPCTAPHTTAALGEGAHTFEVRATDSSANANVDPTPAARGFSVDTTTPDTKVAGPTKVKTKRKRARISFTLTSTEAGATFECSLDGAAFSGCASPFSATVRRGAHTLAVRSSDSTGNQDATPVTVSFRVVKKKLKRRPGTP